MTIFKHTATGVLCYICLEKPPKYTGQWHNSYNLATNKLVKKDCKLRDYEAVASYNGVPVL